MDEKETPNWEIERAEEIVEKIREILKTDDLDTTTISIVRKKLEDHFGIPLSGKTQKKFVKNQILLFVQERREQEAEEEAKEDEDGGEGNEEEEVVEEVKKRKPGGFTQICSLSPKLQNFLGESELPRTQVAKRVWAYIHEHDLQDPNDRRRILCDGKLFDILNVKAINMFQMNKVLSKHIWPLNTKAPPSESDEMEMQPGIKREREEGSTKSKKEKKMANRSKKAGEEPPPSEFDEMEMQPGIKRGREEGSTKSKKEKKMANRSKKAGEELESSQKDKRPKTKSNFHVPLTLSSALVKFLGTDESMLPRTEVVKRMWDYIKQNNLQDPKDRRQILCDDKLVELFEVEQFTGFTVTKLLSPHLSPKPEQ